jgi:hypothetical protein
MQSRVLFQVADAELDHCVVTVEPIDRHGVGGEVGQEGVVTPRGEQGPVGGLRRGGCGARRAAADPVAAFGDLRCSAVVGVVDVHP